MNRPGLFTLENRIAIVTGAAGFLGREHCDALAEAGANLVVTDVDEAACTTLAAELSGAHGIDAVAIAADISKSADVKALVAAALARFDRIDVLVNNAQLQLSSALVPFEELAAEDWNRILGVNLTGTFLCCQAVGPHMRERRGGSIINFGSIYGLIGPDFRVYEGTALTTAAVYSASKAGVYGLTRYLATY